MNRSTVVLSLCVPVAGCRLPEAATAWTVASEEIPLGPCATATASVRHTARSDDIVIVFRLDNKSAQVCSIAIEGVAIGSDAGEANRKTFPSAPRLAPSTTVFLEVRVPLDSRSHWEQNERDIPLVLRTRINGAPSNDAKWHLVR